MFRHLFFGVLPFEDGRYRVITAELGVGRIHRFCRVGFDPVFRYSPVRTIFHVHANFFLFLPTNLHFPTIFRPNFLRNCRLVFRLLALTHDELRAVPWRSSTPRWNRVARTREGYRCGEDMSYVVGGLRSPPSGRATRRDAECTWCDSGGHDGKGVSGTRGVPYPVDQ